MWWEKVLLGGEIDSLLRVIASAPLVYVAVVTMIRVSGKRSTSQMNNFDWIVTVAIGSLVGSGIILEDIGVIQALLAILLLLVFQYVLTWSVIRSEVVADLVKASPRLLVYQGQLLHRALRDERISEREVIAAVRGQGYFSLQEVVAVVLETDATFSVLAKRQQDGNPATLESVTGFHPK